VPHVIVLLFILWSNAVHAQVADCRDAETLCREAQWLLANGKPADALLRLRRVPEEDSLKLESTLQEAELWLAASMPDSALSAIHALLGKKTSLGPKPLLLAAQAQHALQRFEDEQALLATCAKLYPFYSDTLLGEWVDSTSTREVWYDSTGHLQAIGNAIGERSTGCWLFFHPNSEVRAGGCYDALGRKEGRWLHYHPDGSRAAEYSYVADSLDGTQYEYYVGGELKRVWTSRLGPTIGMERHFYPSGPLRAEVPYEKGLIHGTIKQYYPAGHLKRETEWQNGRPYGALREWYPSGQLKLEAEQNLSGVADKFVQYYENGQIETQGVYDGGGRRTGTFRNYEADGTLIEVLPYLNGQLEGEAKTWNVDGSIQSIGRYEEGLREGRMLLFRADSQPEGQLEFRRDLIIQYRFYDEKLQVLSSDADVAGNVVFRRKGADGTVLEEGPYRLGKRSGVWKTFYANGALQSTAEFRNDSMTGLFRVYHPDGTLRMETAYVAGYRQGPHASYYSNGRLEAAGCYLHDTLDGVWQSFYVNGQPQARQYYRNGQLVGRQVFFDVGGAVEHAYHIREDETDWLCWYRVGGNSAQVDTLFPSKRDTTYARPYEGNQTSTPFAKMGYRHAEAHGSWTYYRPDGKLQGSQEYHLGEAHGKVRFLHADGVTPWVEGAYHRGERTGLWVWRRADGHPEVLGAYVADREDGTWLYQPSETTYGRKESYRLGLPHGIWEYFDTDSLPMLRLHYRLGSLERAEARYPSDDRPWKTLKLKGESGRIELFGPQGQPLFRGELLAGSWQGEQILYYPDGRPAQRSFFKNGELEGAIMLFHPSGQVRVELNYTAGKLQGNQRYYDTEGMLRREQSYEAGLHHGDYKTYNVAGGLLAHLRYAQDLLVGVVK
jgi:uncharacterized protein